MMMKGVSMSLTGSAVVRAAGYFLWIDCVIDAYVVNY